MFFDQKIKYSSISRCVLIFYHFLQGNAANSGEPLSFFWFNHYNGGVIHVETGPVLSPEFQTA